jgi:BirA family biotin operon repressor/biotin-[acetyl-CoA-carboxylase] ligase
MNQEILEKQLGDLPLGGIRYFDTTDSTNDRAVELIQKGVPDRYLVIANEQKKGRGRIGRIWFTPPDSALAFSLISYPKTAIPQENLTRMTGLGALAVCEGLKETYQLQAQIKWPNDVLLYGKKVGGVLAEGHWIGGELLAIIVGLGINVAPESVPNENDIDFPATSICDSLGRPVNRMTVLKDVLSKLLFWEDKIAEPEFVSTWQEYLAYIDERVQIQYENETLQEGILIGIDDQGKLVLHTEYGEEAIFSVGEIHLRPSIDR